MSKNEDNLFTEDLCCENYELSIFFPSHANTPRMKCMKILNKHYADVEKIAT